MAGKNLALSLLISAKDGASSVIKKIRDRLEETGNSTGKYARDTQQAAGATDRFAGSVGGLVGRLTALAGAYFSVTKIKSALDSVLETGGLFERLGNQMTAAFRSVDEGAQATAWITRFAKDTPFQLEGVTKAFQTLKNFGLDPMDGTMQAIADKSSELGAEQQTLEGISLALGQAWAKQKLQGEEILQLIERGVPVWELLQRVTGRNVEELNKMSAAGELGRDVIQALIQEMGRSSEGAAASMMSSWEGLTSNLSDTWTQFLNTIAKSGTLDFFKAQLDGLLRTVEDMAQSGQLQRIAESISDFFVGTAVSIKNAASFVAEFSSQFKALASIIVGAKLAQVFQGIGAAATGAATGANLLAGALARTAAVARAGLYGIIATQLFEIANAYRETKAINAKTAQTQADLDAKTAKLTERYADLSEQLGISIKSMTDLDKAVADGLVQFNEQTGAWERVSNAMTDYDKAVADAVASQEAIVGAFGKTLTEMTKIGAASDAALAKFEEWGNGSERNIDNIAEELRKLSDRELSELKSALEDAFITGIDRSEELGKALDAINTEEVTRAWKTLGQTSQQSLDAAAQAAKRAYLTIRDSGTASSADLTKAWDAYIGKVQDAASAIDQVDAAERRRQQNLQQLDELGLEPEQKAARQKQQLAQETAEFQRLMEQGRFEEARRLSEQTEQLAFDLAKTEKQAYLDGQVLAFDATRAREQYLQSIERTKQALDELSKREQEALPEAGGGQDNGIEQRVQAGQQLIELLKEARQPVNVQINDNFDATISKSEILLANLQAIASALPAAQSNAQAQLNNSDAIAREALMRGRR